MDEVEDIFEAEDIFEVEEFSEYKYIPYENMVINLKRKIGLIFFTKKKVKKFCRQLTKMKD